MEVWRRWLPAVGSRPPAVVLFRVVIWNFFRRALSPVRRVTPSWESRNLNRLKIAGPPWCGPIPPSPLPWVPCRWGTIRCALPAWWSMGHIHVNSWRTWQRTQSPPVARNESPGQDLRCPLSHTKGANPHLEKVNNPFGNFQKDPPLCLYCFV